MYQQQPRTKAAKPKPIKTLSIMDKQREYYVHDKIISSLPPQWGAADAEIKVPSGENTELKRSASKA